jgi:hypothetical protein
LTVYRDVLRFGRLPEPRAEEQMSRGIIGKCGNQGAAIAKIAAEDRLRESPYTVQPCSTSSAARLPPTIPVLPAINAVRPVVIFLLARPTADTSGWIDHELSYSWGTSFDLHASRGVKQVASSLRATTLVESRSAVFRKRVPKRSYFRDRTLAYRRPKKELADDLDLRPATVNE